MSKTICVLSYPRTGSNWLCDLLMGQNSYSAGEIFSETPLNFYWNLQFLMTSVYAVDKTIVDSFSKIFSPEHFYSNPQIKKTVTETIKKTKDLYSIELLLAMKKLTYSINSNFIFKLFPIHTQHNGLDYNQILNLADYVVLNYRNDLVESFISFKKALLSERWTSFDKKIYLEKIQWNKQEYQTYATDTLTSFEKLKDACKKTPSKVVYLSYEEIHQPNLSHHEKVKLLNDRFLQVDPSFNWYFKNEVAFQKENYIQNLEDNFLNPEDFLKDYPNLRTTIFPKNQSHLPTDLQKLDWTSDKEETLPAQQF